MLPNAQYNLMYALRKRIEVLILQYLRDEITYADFKFLTDDIIFDAYNDDIITCALNQCIFMAESLKQLMSDNQE